MNLYLPRLWIRPKSKFNYPPNLNTTLEMFDFYLFYLERVLGNYLSIEHRPDKIRASNYFT